MNRFTNMTIMHQIFLGTTITCGIIGSSIGAAVGLESGIQAMDIALNRIDYNNSRMNTIFKFVYGCTNMIGQPIIYAIGGMTVGVTAPILLPILYCFHKIR